MENNMPKTEKLLRDIRTEEMRRQMFLNAVGQYVSAEMYDYLVENGFFMKPAAIKHHGNYEGGLFDHSFEVMKCLVHMTKKLGIEWQNERSPYIVGMFHDLCKMDDYIKDGQEWVYNNSPVISGHGEKSVMMLAQFYTLTEEEVFCIRFHMGAYKSEDWNGFDKAIRKYESVLWTHTADMYASKVKKHMKPPCKDCSDRFFDPVTKKRCHNTCERYARYHREREQLRAENQERVSFNSYKFDNVPRLKRASANKMFRSKKK